MTALSDQHGHRLAILNCQINCELTLWFLFAMANWARSVFRTWIRWTYLVNGCNPARIDDPDEQRKLLQRFKKSNKRYLYVIGSVFILLSPLVALIVPRQLTLPEILGGLASGFATFALGVGALIWAWRS